MTGNENLSTAKDSIWSSAMRVAVGLAQQTISSETELARGLYDGLLLLGLNSGMALFTPGGKLEIQGVSISSKTLEALKRLSGTSIVGFRFDPREIDVYREALDTGQPVFAPLRSEIIAQLTPKPHQALVPQIMRLLGEEPEIAAPLMLDDDPVGMINLNAPWLTADDLPLVAALANYVAIALGNVRARTRMHAALERERRRNKALEVIASEPELPEVIHRVLELAVDATGADAGAIALIEQGGEAVAYPYLLNLPEEIKRHPSRKDHGLAWQVITSKEPILLSEYADHPEAIPSWVEAGVHAFLGVPLIADQEAIGVMGVFSSNPSHTFREEQVEIVEAIANMVAIAVRKAQLFAEADRLAEEAQALTRTARSISASLDLDTVLNLIAEEAKTLLQADGSRIHLHDSERDVLRCVVAHDPQAELFMAAELQPGEGFVGFVVDRGEPLLINDPASDPRGTHLPGSPEDKLESLILAPLKIRQKTMGAMAVRRLGTQHPFQPSELDLLNAFAAQAAIAIENAHLYGQIAAQAQRLEVEVAERTHDLSLSEARYRALVENSLAGIFQISTETVLTYANQAFAELIGYQEEELIGLPLTELVTPQYRNLVVERFYARLRGERPTAEVHEVELLSRNGRRIPALLASSTISDDGIPRGGTGLVLDISQRKMLEAALRAERDRLYEILTSVGEPVFVMDPHGLIEFVNPAWERLNGFHSEEALGQTPKIMKSGYHSQDFYEEMWDTILSGRVWRGEVINRRKDGSTYESVVTVQPVFDPQKGLINLVGLIHDISALKEVDRLKSQFVSDVSHELRTPLTNIRLYLDLLRATEDLDKADRYLETLIRESDRLGHLIEDLLSLSRLEAGATPFHPEAVDLTNLLSALVDDRQSLATHRGLKLELDAEPDLPSAHGDKRLLTQVFTNLLTNAMNYTAEGGRISIRLKRNSTPSADWVMVDVEDTGVGIHPSEQLMIFQRFYRGRASETSDAVGTGLGLAICKEIAELHGGRITVQSEGVPGRGACFTVWLPIQE